MATQPTPLTLQDIWIGKQIEVIDRLRKHGIRAKIDDIIQSGEQTMIAFTNTERVRPPLQYMWRAAAMGLVTGISAFWETYAPGQAPDGIVFGSLYTNWEKQRRIG